MPSSRDMKSRDDVVQSWHMNKRHIAGLIEAALKEIHEVIAVGFSADYNEDALNDYLRTFADHVASAQKQHD